MSLDSKPEDDEAQVRVERTIGGTTLIHDDAAWRPGLPKNLVNNECVVTRFVLENIFGMAV